MPNGNTERVKKDLFLQPSDVFSTLIVDRYLKLMAGNIMQIEMKKDHDANPIYT